MQPFAGFRVGFCPPPKFVLGAAGRFLPCGASATAQRCWAPRISRRGPVRSRRAPAAGDRAFQCRPVCITSTLFLFYAKSVLRAPGEGPLLVAMFFLSAAVAAPFWWQTGRAFRPKPSAFCDDAGDCGVRGDIVAGGGGIWRGVRCCGFLPPVRCSGPI